MHVSNGKDGKRKKHKNRWGKLQRSVNDFVHNMLSGCVFRAQAHVPFPFTERLETCNRQY